MTRPWVYSKDRRAFGDMLRQARLGSGTSQAEVAALADIGAPYYGRIEQGARLPGLVTLARLRRILAFEGNELIACLGQRAKPVCRGSGMPRFPRPSGDAPFRRFGGELREARRRKQWTQFEVASAIGSFERGYRRIEGGHRLTSLAMLARLHCCLAFDANRVLDELLKDSIRQAQLHAADS